MHHRAVSNLVQAKSILRGDEIQGAASEELQHKFEEIYQCEWRAAQQMVCKSAQRALASFPPPLHWSTSVFALLVADGGWGLEGNGSGPGSTDNATVSIREILYEAIAALDVNSMIDVPCGGAPPGVPCPQRQIRCLFTCALCKSGTS